MFLQVGGGSVEFFLNIYLGNNGKFWASFKTQPYRRRDRMMHDASMRGSVPVRRDGRGGTEVAVKITSEIKMQPPSTKGAIVAK